MGIGLCGRPLTLCPGEFSPVPALAGTSSSDNGSKLSGDCAIVGIAIASNGGGANSVPATESLPASPVALDTNQLKFFGNAPAVYDFEDLMSAWGEFLGYGTFGSAYKLELNSGVMMWVKRIWHASIPEQEFTKKIEAIGAMNHRNIIPLRAYCYSTSLDKKLLIYDYMPIGSLSWLLHRSRGSGGTPLNWEIRTSIALGAASGIEYIHSTSSTATHGNIKSSNILLDSSFEAKVSDNGITHLVGARITSNRFAGYRAPEATDTRRVTQKTDVYSFGVVLLELLTGKAPAQALINEGGLDLPRWVRSIIRNGRTTEVFVMELLSVEEEMVQFLHLGVNCTAEYPDQRPTMSRVVMMIEYLEASMKGELFELNNII